MSAAERPVDLRALHTGRDVLAEALSRPTAQRRRVAPVVDAAVRGLAAPGRPPVALPPEVVPLPEETAVGDQVAAALAPVVAFTPTDEADRFRAYRFGGVVWRADAWAEVGDDVRAVLERLPRPSPVELDAMAVDGRSADAHTKQVKADGLRKVKAREKWLSERGLRVARNLVAAHPGLRVSVEEWDNHPALLATATGVVDLHTGEPAEGDPQRWRLTRGTAASWSGLTAECPQWTEFLSVVAPDPELREYLRLVAGAFVVGSALDHAVYVVIGPESTGKGTFAEALLSVLGAGPHGVAVAADPRLFTDREGHSSPVTDLRGRRLAWLDEVEFGGALSESKLKRLTGGGLVTARRMRENNTTFATTHTALVTTNAPLRTTADPAVWRRLRYLPFEAPVSSALSVATKHAAAGAEGPGVLAWAVSGARDVLARPARLADLPEPAAARTAALRGQSDHVAEFLAVMTTDDEPAVTPGLPLHPGTRAGTPAPTLRATFAEWCRRNRYPVLDAETFGKRMHDLGLASAGRRVVNGQKVAVYPVTLKVGSW